MIIMTKNRMLQYNGSLPSQRVFGFNPKIPGGVLSDDGGNRIHPDKIRQGDLTMKRSMKMRKAVVEAFLEADADEILRRIVLTGPRPMQEYDQRKFRGRNFRVYGLLECQGNS